MNRRGRNNAIIKSTVNLCWFLFKWGLALVVVVALAASPFYYRQIFFKVEEQVRARVEAALAQQFPELEVHVRSARLADEGIEVRGVSILEPGTTGPQPELAFLDEVFLECQTSLQELASGEPEIRGVRLTRPVIRATRRPGGHFSIEKLLAGKKSDRPVPPTTIENGVIEIFDPLKNPASTLTLRDIHVTLSPPHDAPQGGPLELQGYLVADEVQRVEVVGTIDPLAGTWSLSGTVDGLQISPELCNCLFDPSSSSMAALSNVRVRAPANLSFRVAGGPDAAPQFEVNGSVTGGRIEHPLFPHPLTDLQTRIHCDNAGIRIRELSARHGQTVWTVEEFDRQGYGPASPCMIRASGRRVRLDPEWRNTLPRKFGAYWVKYDPKGEIDLDCTLVFDGQEWKPTLVLTARGNGSFTCDRFPYRLERGNGTVKLDGNVLDIDVVAYSGARPVALKGRFLNPGPEFTGSIEIRGQKIQFDENLFAAILRDKSRSAVRSLNPRGTFDIYARLWRDVNDPLPRPRIHQHFVVTLNRSSVTYDKLAYPLSNLQGTVEMHDGNWKTKGEIVGTNDTGVVSVTGALDVTDERDQLALHIDAKNVPLEEELRDALPPAQQQVWNALRPRGNVDLQADVTYDSTVRKPSIDLRLQPRDDATSMGTSIEPVAFPYRMEKLGGQVHYRDGHVKLTRIHAAHRQTQMHGAGTCDLNPDGSWRLNLTDLAVDRVRLTGEDQELVAALPAVLRRAIGELRPTGPINLNGALRFGKAGPQAPLDTGWDVDLLLNQASLQVGPKLENIFGCVRLRGSSLGQRYTSFGELKLDSLTYKNFQFTEVLGPMWLDNENVFLGAMPGDPRKDAPASRITAKLFGGVVAADCQVRLGDVPQYRLVATLSGADLAQFAAENFANPRKLNGKVLATVDLQGNRGVHTLVGSGDIHLTAADVYELPLVVSLLKIVRAKRPDSTAFTESDIAFEIKGQHVLLKRIDLRGDAVSLAGLGEFTLDGQTNPIRLELHTMVGRGNLPLISGMFSEASQQILKIHVAGTLDHPVTRTEAFPAATQALEALRAEPDKTSRRPQLGEVLWPFGARQ